MINSEICSNVHRRRAGSLRRSILATIRPTRPRSEGFRVPSCPIVPWCFWSDKTFANVSSKLKMVCGLCQAKPSKASKASQAKPSKAKPSKASKASQASKAKQSQAKLIQFILVSKCVLLCFCVFWFFQLLCASTCILVCCFGVSWFFQLLCASTCILCVL